jgi:hypothetical protein
VEDEDSGEGEVISRVCGAIRESGPASAPLCCAGSGGVRRVTASQMSMSGTEWQVHACQHPSQTEDIERHQMNTKGQSLHRSVGKRTDAIFYITTSSISLIDKIFD